MALASYLARGEVTAAQVLLPALVARGALIGRRPRQKSTSATGWQVRIPLAGSSGPKRWQSSAPQRTQSNLEAALAADRRHKPTPPAPSPPCGAAPDTIEAYLARELPRCRYAGDAAFLRGPTPRTERLRARYDALVVQENANDGVLSLDNKTPSSVTAFPPGYLCREDELIVGLQTDEPLKRAMKPFGGWRMTRTALQAYGSDMAPETMQIFEKGYRKTHNDAVFQIYDDEMRRARSNKLLTGLPDAYGRGRIIGDYRRVALFGVDELIVRKKSDLKGLGGVMTEEAMRLREETADQIKALVDLKAMAASYGYDISKPAVTAREAVQWVYFAYLGAIKEQDGAAMSLGRVDGFLDTYFERDIESGLLDEEGAQELVDQLVLKLRMARHLRTPEYNELFAGDPTWVTAVLGGLDSVGNSMVTKTSFRLLQTVFNLGHAPEPNLTVLWARGLPEPWKAFCARVSLESCTLQYENDDLMRPIYGDGYGIACCVSAMTIGKQMQFFGARCNLPKLLLYSLNGGRDEVSGQQVAPPFPPLSPPATAVAGSAAAAAGSAGATTAVADFLERHPEVAAAGKSVELLDFDVVVERFDAALSWIAKLYSNTMNIIHYSHDRYCYEALQMALHDTHVHRFMAFGASGIGIVADSLSAIKHAKVFAIRNGGHGGIATEFAIEGDFPKYGNDDDRVDTLATWAVKNLNDKLHAQHMYRGAEPTLSLLTITSNVVYGKATGNTPDGRVRGQPFAPGANPQHGRDTQGALAALNSVAKLPYEDCMDGISNTFSIEPHALGKDPDTRRDNLVALLDGYFRGGGGGGGVAGHHLNVNSLSRSTLLDAMDHPEKYPQLTVRVSGYAVHFNRLTREQQLEVISRTFHEQL